MLEWHPGDRVIVILPDHDRPPRHGVYVPVHGTVAAVEPHPDREPSVHVDLDRQVNGLTTCAASASELRGERTP